MPGTAIVSGDKRSFNTPAHIAALETRVSGLERGVQSVAESVQALSVKFDQRSTTPWPVIWSAAGVCLAFLTTVGALAYSPVMSNVARLDLQIEALKGSYLSRAESDARLQSEIGRREAALATIRENNTRQDIEIARLRDNQVTRSEHERIWAEQAKTREKLESRMLRLEDRALTR